MKICLAGEGAQGITHADALRKFEGIEIDTLAGGIAADAEAFAHERGIGHWSLDLEECLARDGVEAVILTTPNQVHCAQTELAWGQVGPLHPELGIPLDLSIGMRAKDGRLVTSAQSFNNTTVRSTASTALSGKRRRCCRREGC